MPRYSDPAAGDKKRKCILDAAMAEFSQGYANASTDAIVKGAGVSKGLLFHYFGNKKGLFLQAYNYAIQTVMEEFYGLINLEQKDILERWKQIALLKMDLMQKHPAIFTFIAHASFPDSKEVQDEIAKRREDFTNEAYPKLFYDIDRSLFRDDIDADTAIEVIIYTIEGYAQSEADPKKTAEDYYGEYGRYLEELDRFIALFRNSFYKGKKGPSGADQ